MTETESPIDRTKTEWPHILIRGIKLNLYVTLCPSVSCKYYRAPPRLLHDDMHRTGSATVGTIIEPGKHFFIHKIPMCQWNGCDFLCDVDRNSFHK